MQPSCALIVLFLAVSGVWGRCPPRSDIHPCSCHEVGPKKKVSTIIICHGLQNNSDLVRLRSYFIGKVFEKFVLLDSFPEPAALAPNFMNLNFRQIEIVDTKLSQCFACPIQCDTFNIHLTSLQIRNSTPPNNRLCTLCAEQRRLWMDCLRKLEHLEISHGHIKYIEADYFPFNLMDLQSIDFSHNLIERIDPNIFRNLPKLKTVNLSFNKLKTFSRIFNRRTELEHLDLSYNELTTLPGDLMPNTPKLRTLIVAYNNINELKNTNWRVVPDKLYKVDFTANPVQCNCGIKWINGTFGVGVQILGHCDGPAEMRGSRLRVASRNLVERCDPQGNIGTRRSATSAPN